MRTVCDSPGAIVREAGSITVQVQEVSHLRIRSGRFETFVTANSWVSSRWSSER
jgi:hypothetical protein